MSEQGGREFMPLSPKARADINEALEIGGVGGLLDPKAREDIDQALQRGGADYLVDLYRDGILRHPLERTAEAIMNCLVYYPLIPDSTPITINPEKYWGFYEKPDIEPNNLWELYEKPYTDLDNLKGEP